MTLRVRRVGPEAAEEVLAVVRAAFGARPVLDPPADALGETTASVAAALAGAGGLLAERDGRPVGALLLSPADGVVYLRRFGVLPSEQGRGVARALLVAACDAVEDATEMAVLAREELPATIRFWQARGFAEVRRDPPYLELRRRLTARYDVPDAPAMRALGASLGGELRAGDLVLLTGELGAGKTTFTQGLGEGLGVRGPVTSPTFVIARVHPSLVDGPALVHVDAYRLGGLAELEDLDLDTSLDEAVTVVEWGGGLAEGLADSRLDVVIERTLGEGTDEDAEGGGEGADPRRVRVRGHGPRWHP
ncbi:MAG TPA: tRNA (adenosine(37)-N6)-threonylcarbamoyltransferase complex ATPase subunit type 1 TsaE [Nocardioides sp.]|uniref:tRNA (adenosine(37)-N6)-threonylcarbamoyltransferase complex ATPase subunit type 1 TsaE n=1 Tax=Nocardioides sp. TaxID=35761 RepID=UPI002BB20AF7|nr:tRNA (adenosine(37)-N6)-threonylcarbamoyltransferase complex ATPase subunit type 1 TsaE [Nocardioides sp.]HQR28630.1 tRNA (adenosine(37)-N6)-threonylcarbamoyltransferase complex ATPase subunit type 1 TsaE [Nocardioides sp.]